MCLENSLVQKSWLPPRTSCPAQFELETDNYEAGQYRFELPWPCFHQGHAECPRAELHPLSAPLEVGAKKEDSRSGLLSLLVHRGISSGYRKCKACLLRAPPKSISTALAVTIPTQAR